MKGFLYSLLGLLLFLSFAREKEVIHTPEFIYSEVYEESYAEIEVDETGVVVPLGEGLFSNSQGKSRRTVSSVFKVCFVPSFSNIKDSWFTHALLQADVKYKSIARTLFYTSTYHRLHLFLCVLI